jgi:hypothetical protein
MHLTYGETKNDLIVRFYHLNVLSMTNRIFPFLKTCKKYVMMNRK